MDFGSVMAGGSIVSNMLGTVYANEQSRKEAKNMRNFQSEMSSSAHQREVADLKAAGLNPILSAGGSGATSPAGAMAPIQAPQINMPDILSYGISLKQLEQADKRIEIDQKTADASIIKSLSETQLNKLRSELAQRGMPRALLEGEAATVLKKGINYLKNQVQKPKLPTHSPEMSQP